MSASTAGRTSPAQSGPAPGLSDESAMSPIPSSPRRVTAADPSHPPAERASGRTPPRGGGAASDSGRSLVTGLIVGGIVLFVWWYWRDTRPVADLRTIETWIGNREFGLAGKELREHLRRTPHDGAARMMLARVLAARGDLAGCTRELHQVPSWWPQKAEALYREGQAYLLMDRARDAEAALLAVIDADPLASGGSGRIPRCQPGAALALCHRESLGRRARHPVEGLRSGDAGVPAYRTGDANPVRAGADRPDRVGQAAQRATWPPIPRTGRHGAPWPTPSWRWASTPRPSATCETAWMPGPRTPASGATT